MATRQLAQWICDLKYADLPENVVHAAVRSFQNSLGCIIGGARHPTTIKALKSQSLEPSTPICTLIGQQEEHGTAQRSSRSGAVLVNGIASHVHDYDDTHLHTIIHPTGAIVVALLADIECEKARSGKVTSGKDFITALVVGIETSLRLGNAVSPNHYSAGWHITGTVSPIGVAAALSKLNGLSVEQTVHAIGIASTQPVGIRAHFGTDTKAFHAGRAAQDGIEAVNLASCGFTAAQDALEGRRGWVEVLGHGANSLDEQISQLLTLAEAAKSGKQAESWEIEKNTFKPFPCGIVIHPTIDACIQLHEELGLKDKARLQKTDSVHLKVHHLVLDLTGKKEPRDGLEAKFSVYHGAAIGLALGSATPAEYEDHVVQDSAVLDIRRKIQAEEDENIRSDEVVVTLKFANGEQSVKHVEHAVGSISRPMTDDELKEKFLRQTEQALGSSKVAELNQLCWNVVKADDMTTVLSRSI